jgi:hypothetical protein
MLFCTCFFTLHTVTSTWFFHHRMLPCFVPALSCFI